ncbi:MAG: hypothetical protein L6R39_007781 [Caloplaca ligustica]|nr:MAG: hypothetical protein L6R39_007781 [Caloplaca ligustica]
MSSQRRSDLSPGPQIRETPGAYPSTPEDFESPGAVSSELSLSQAVYKRRAEYTVSRKIRIKVGTWNVAALRGTEKDIGSWFVGGKGLSESLSVLSFEDKKQGEGSENLEDVGHQEARRSKKASTTPLNDSGFLPGGEDIALYVLGLQEIVDVASTAEALKPYNDPHPSRKWKSEVEKALPTGYVKVAEQQLIGLYLIIFAAPEIAPTISDVSTTSVGTGLMGYMGNKGAVIARIVLGEFTRIVFVDCHLRAGVEKGSLERRNWDASQVLRRTRFSPTYNASGEVEEASDIIGGEDFAFWFGDLNYRLEGLPGEDVRRLLMLHTKNEYRLGEPSKRKIDAELALHEASSNRESIEDDSSSNTSSSTRSATSTATSATLHASEDSEPSSDPASLQTTLASLLPHDQLHQQMRKRKAFHDGWREGPIDFLPTYKYDVGSVGMFDSSEKKRGPSWCDRILFRTRRDKQAYEEKLRKEEAAKKRDEEMKAHGMDDPSVNEEEVLFEYNPAKDGADDDYDPDADNGDPESFTTAAGGEDKLHLEYYTSHQRVLSSDHKPLDAVFTLIYDAADPDRKAKLHQEVARELDKAENERRPAVTVIVDHHDDKNHGNSHSSADQEGIDFGDVRHDSPRTRYITVANTGRVPATVGFTDRIASGDQVAGAAPPWLHFHFHRPSDRERSSPESDDVYTLEPGDAANVELKLHVTSMDLVRRLNEGTTHLEDVLVLRIHNGRDYFLPVRANWLQSSFGRSVDDLVRVPEGGVRSQQQQHSKQREEAAEDDGVKWSAPREIFRLTEAIEELIERAVAEWGMRSMDEQHPPWEVFAWPFTHERDDATWELRERVREALDTDTEISKALSSVEETPGPLQRVEAVAQILLAFLESMSDGIVTATLWATLEQHIMARGQGKSSSPSTEEERMQILDTLATSPARSTSFTFITAMLGRVLAEIVAAAPERAAGLHGRLEEEYAIVFAEAIIRAPEPPNGRERRASLARRRRVVEVFVRAS